MVQLITIFFLFSNSTKKDKTENISSTKKPKNDKSEKDDSNNKNKDNDKKKDKEDSNTVIDDDGGIYEYDPIDFEWEDRDQNKDKEKDKEKDKDKQNSIIEEDKEKKPKKPRKPRTPKLPKAESDDTPNNDEKKPIKRRRSKKIKQEQRIPPLKDKDSNDPEKLDGIPGTILPMIVPIPATSDDDYDSDLINRIPVSDDDYLFKEYIKINKDKPEITSINKTNQRLLRLTSI